MSSIPATTFVVFGRFSAKKGVKLLNLAVIRYSIWRNKNCPHLKGCFICGQFQLCFAILQSKS